MLAATYSRCFICPTTKNLLTKFTFHRIHNVDQVDGTLTTRLPGKPAPWSDVVETYDLDFGGRKVLDIRKRDLLGDIGESAAVVSGGQVSGSNVKLYKSITFGISAGMPGKRITIFADNRK
jgi:hypothetical protein